MKLASPAAGEDSDDVTDVSVTVRWVLETMGELGRTGEAKIVDRGRLLISLVGNGRRKLFDMEVDGNSVRVVRVSDVGKSETVSIGTRKTVEVRTG